MPQNYHFIHLKKQKLLYGRVPKAANSSIKAALSRLLTVRPPKGTKTTSDKFWAHSTNAETELMTLTRARRRRFTHFSFSFVRNPFDRLIAAYNNKVIQIDEPPLPMLKMGIKHGMPFPDFLSVLTNTALDEFDVHVIPQNQLLCIGNSIVPKFVGRVEQINNHWAALRVILARRQIEVMESLPQKNVRRNERVGLENYFYKDSLIDKALKLYSKDIDLFYANISIDDLIANKPLPNKEPILSRSLHFTNWLRENVARN
jgi:hypothetical protein